MFQHGEEKQREEKMCGIAIVVCGIRIDLSSCVPLNSVSPSSMTEKLQFTVEDIKSALCRRGPDRLGEKKVYLCRRTSAPGFGQEIYSVISNKEHKTRTDAILGCNGTNLCFDKVENGEPDNCSPHLELVTEMHFLGATLQLRGMNPVSQPLTDSWRNVLAYNGEIFGGIHINRDDNDGEVLLESLGKCCYGENSSIPGVLSEIKGPWALIYWQEKTKTLWFGRDAFGRRSLLVHWPTVEDPRFLLSSISPTSSIIHSPGSDAENVDNSIKFWEELPCGIYSLSMAPSVTDDASLHGELKKHEWNNTVLKELIDWERRFIEPTDENRSIPQHKMQTVKSDMHSAFSGFAQAVLKSLEESVTRRTSLYRIFLEEEELVPVAVLFSGGLDSMILSSLLDQCLDPKYEIDLLNVSFDRQSAPDRISGIAGKKELEKISPLRRWNLVEIDADLSELSKETKHVMSLINPANTYMDLNIGIALWLAARGDGWINKQTGNHINDDVGRVKYKSNARILLVGAGADEQCAGYGRHRTKFRNGSWARLHEEMKVDMQRIWKRNLGRDDRCIADNGKEARFPFLDEDVIRTLLDIPLWEIADLDQPSGTGDKKILREVARLLGLHEAATLPKRAIQFGSRIARESNRKNFGSNRAANQAAAGSAVFNVPSD